MRTPQNKKGQAYRLRPSVVLLTVWCLFFGSCVQNGSPRTKRTSDGLAQDAESGGSGSGVGSGAGPSGGVIGSALDDILNNGKAEIRHIIDPFDGTYKTKVSIPKNFSGILYLSGLNVTSLSNRLVSVRFRFGREKEELILPASIGRAPGITPQTDIEVVRIDMYNKPFEDMRLFYDLYDYNNYDSDGDGVEEGTPVSDPRHTGLYCRGLNLDDDPTFEATASNSTCDAAGEVCYYSYAKLVDSGLYDPLGIALNPSEPQIELGSSGYGSDTSTQNLAKCLPDSPNQTYVSSSLDLTSALVADIDYGTVLGLTTDSSDAITTFEIDGGGSYDSKYTYYGPYRPDGRNYWQVSSDALFHDPGTPTIPTGLFRGVLGNAPVPTIADPNLKAMAGYQSYLFPRAGKMDLSVGIDHFSSTTAIATSRSMTSLAASGESDWVDGCNIRRNTYDSYNNETIASCNVTATIELIAIDQVSGEITTLASTDEIKLQLLRSSLTDYQGQEVLFTAMKTCTSSNACGSNECCFNSRCWSKELVSQCIEDAPVVGNLGVGESCSSDYQCSSFCCNGGTGKCSVHLNSNEQQVLCSKGPGQSCVSKEFCRKEYVNKCFIVKTGFNGQGQVTCARQCYPVPTYGDCLAGVCQPPVVPTPPEFDPNNPDCSEAIDPPTSFE